MVKGHGPLGRAPGTRTLTDRDARKDPERGRALQFNRFRNSYAKD